MHISQISIRATSCLDFIKEGWSKKDWAIHLLPLGGAITTCIEEIKKIGEVLLSHI